MSDLVRSGNGYSLKSPFDARKTLQYFATVIFERKTLRSETHLVAVSGSSTVTAL